MNGKILLIGVDPFGLRSISVKMIRELGCQKECRGQVLLLTLRTQMPFIGLCLL